MVVGVARSFPFKQSWSALVDFYLKHKTTLIVSLFVFATVQTYLYPQLTADLWMTRDQQGRILFYQGYYELAARRFNDIRWKAYSFYASEQFDPAATLFAQLEQTNDVLARGNALAHARRYVQARNIYKDLLELEPSNKEAQHNIEIVQKIIDDVNRLSESQQPEAGDAPQELGDNAQTGDGAEKQEGRKQIVEQYDAQQLLLDPNLNAMWLRQVQKDPGLFLSNKFYMQNQKEALDAKETTDEPDKVIDE
jgi:tetratricopeptide (TPR) repeat protein